MSLITMNHGEPDSGFNLTAALQYCNFCSSYAILGLELHIPYHSCLQAVVPSSLCVVLPSVHCSGEGGIVYCEDMWL